MPKLVANSFVLEKVDHFTDAMGLSLVTQVRWFIYAVEITQSLVLFQLNTALELKSI